MTTPEPSSPPVPPSPDGPPGGARPPRRPGRRAVVAAGAGLVVAGGGAAAWALTRGGDDADGARSAAEALARAWSGGAWDAAGFVRGEGDAPAVPADVAAEQDRLLGGLAGVPTAVTVASVDTARAGEGTATARLDVVHDLAAGLGAPAGSTFRHTGDLTLRRVEEGGGQRWRPVWAPALLHPALADGAVLAVERSQPARADVLDRDSAPVVAETPVVQVGVQPSRTPDPTATAGALAALLGVDADGLADRVRAASPDAFVDVITLRRSDYDAQRDALRPVPGAVFREATRPLALTRAFARGLLGTVAEVSAEQLEAAGGRLAAGDLTGASGLQARYDERLAGRAGVVVRAEGGAGAASRELLRIDALPGEPVRTGLDAQLQQAADDTLAAAPAPAALVALDTETGDVLAVANSPADGGDRALTGRFPPGSTFKVVTTLALLGRGLDPAETVACPPTATVEGRAFSNFEDGALGDVPFRTDFAQSCNTAFVGLSSRLDGDVLRTTAAQLGLGAAWAPGVDAYAGDVPTTSSAVDLAASSFGQGRTLASPLGMAVVAASVAAGERRLPRAVLDPEPEAPAGGGAAGDGAAALDPAQVATLRELMRSVVTEGSATALLQVPGQPVQAKTGTAEHGTGSPPPTHAWVIGSQGTLAFAVFVTEGVSGGSVAAPLAADFLRRAAAVRPV